MRVESYLQSSELLWQGSHESASDGVVDESGTIAVTTSNGATLTSENVFIAACECNIRRVESEMQSRQI